MGVIVKSLYVRDPNFTFIPSAVVPQKLVPSH
nr:MAG TPA: hypothetical protein [Caudoviricetes sp.]DAK87245.1 MAG TPA: hypothetical protein [Caudoviricetes sp.]